MIQTKRMTLRMATEEEMRALIQNEPSEEMKQAYGEMLQGALDHPSEWAWYTVWFMEMNGENIGDLCFKGLNGDGSVEIGYGIHPEYEGQGLMTEAVDALCRWAYAQNGVTRIEAETDPNNKASQRVLEKVGFVPNGVMGEEGPRFVYQK